MIKPEESSKLLSLLGIILTLCGCTTSPVKVAPNVLSSSYDYTKPAQIADQSKPVWVLPIINKGWVPAKVDPKTGDWISGHYTASIIQDGHWATLEEAEQAGRPYIVAGEGKPIVPYPASAMNGVREVPPTGLDGGEWDLQTLNERVKALENLKSNGSTAAPANPAPLSVERQSPPPASESVASGGLSTGVYIPGHSENGDFELPLSNQTAQERIQVHYLPQNRVEITYRGLVYPVQLKSPDDMIRIVLPSTGS